MAEPTFSDRTRAYQQEMFERSMEGNRIIVMDTGSGKTQVAMLRIQAELDRCSAEKRIWFLTPSVELCHQQHTSLQQAMPAYKMRLLTGQDNVDKWSDQKIWDAALDHARVVVSTHAVLKDALRHGFVQLTSLALLVFDEAHHCIKSHPANIIMRIYHEYKITGAGVPHILGLSASLIMSSDLRSVSTIETNLDSVSVTPRLQREDLMRHVSHPECRIIRYGTTAMSDDTTSRGLQALNIALARHRSEHASVTAIVASRSDETQKEYRTIEKFRDKAAHILGELGASAADFFIRETIAFLRNKSRLAQDLQLDMAESMVDTLLAAFDEARVEQSCRQEGTRFATISAKVQCLLDFLMQSQTVDLCGIVFVNQRVVASVLSAMLNDPTHSTGRLRCIPSVGGSSYLGRKFAITELLDRRVQKQALSTFREGHTNVIIATSVLEEGIDIQACNVVACFDLPANLKSYIQRRGRARQSRSRYGLLLEENADQRKMILWNKLESELIALCQEERQQADFHRRIEEENEIVDYILKVNSTGYENYPRANFDVDATLEHLYHFCHLLQLDPCIDPRPIFSIHADECDLMSATVTLPHIVPAHVRQASSKRTWRSQKAAKKDAAFQAYAALYDAGLLNDNLLPLSQQWNVNEGLEEEAPPARVEIPSPVLWNQSEDPNTWCKLVIQIIPQDGHCSTHEPLTNVVLNTCHQLSIPPELKLHWDEHTPYTVRFGPSTPCSKPDPQGLSMMHTFTSALYRAPRSGRHWQVDKELLTLFEPPKDETWVHDMAERPARQLYGEQIKNLVRVASRDDAAYLFREWTQNNEVVCVRLSKRRNFLRSAAATRAIVQDAPTTSVETRSQRTEIFSVDDCTIGAVAVSWARFGLFMPDILQCIHDFTLVDELSARLLHDMPLLSRDGIRTAITAPSARRSYNYQRLEFLGDCVLKYITSCYLFTFYPNWPEGYLTQRRSLLVCNATLACAAIRLDLGRYVISESVDHRNWILPSTAAPQCVRDVSSKALADVVEALIGVAWREAGMDAARGCTNIFLPAMPIPLQPYASKISNGPFLGQYKEVEALIGYTFADPALLSQALTHPSYAQVSKTDSYERLEFLGDAVLDILIAELLDGHVEKLTQGRMTQIKAALVNADLLGFLCFHLKSREVHRAVDDTASAQAYPAETVHIHERALATCMRFHPDMAATYQDNHARYLELQQDVQYQLDYGTAHPWAQLEQLKLNKMFSDMVESILAAVFLDSGQQHSACRVFLERLGLLKYAKRVICEELDVASRKVQTDADETEQRRFS